MPECVRTHVPEARRFACTVQLPPYACVAAIEAAQDVKDRQAYRNRRNQGREAPRNRA